MGMMVKQTVAVRLVGKRRPQSYNVDDGNHALNRSNEKLDDDMFTQWNQLIFLWKA